MLNQWIHKIVAAAGAHGAAESVLGRLFIFPPSPAGMHLTWNKSPISTGEMVVRTGVRVWNYVTTNLI